jgi:hypothetical protein
MRNSTLNHRLVMAQPKPKPAQSKKPPISRFDSFDSRSDDAVLPLARDRFPSPRARAASPSPGWNNGKAIALAIAFAVAMIATIYFLAQTSRTGESYSGRAEPASDEEPLENTARPSEVPSAQPPAEGEARRASGERSGEKLASRMESASHDSSSNSSGHSVPTIGEDGNAARDGHHTLVLPADVSGSCGIGKSGIKDFSDCLARHGARVR